MNLLTRLILAVLAVWRVTHLLASEDGPGDLLARLRKLMGTGFFGRAMDCFQCMSLWVAAPFALFVSRRPLEWFVSWLAVSGAASLLERIGHEPVLIEGLPEQTEGEPHDGMLRSETRTALEKFSDAGTNDRFPSRN